MHERALEAKSANGEWVEKVHDYVIASGSLKGIILQMEVVKDFASRPHQAVSFVVVRGKELQEWNGQKLPKVLPGCSGGRLQGRSMKEKGRADEEAVKDVDRGESGMKPRKKWLQASRRRQARLMVSRRPCKDQLGKVSCEAGIAHKSKMQKRRQAGEKGTRWQHSGMRSKHWRRSWNEEG